MRRSMVKRAAIGRHVEIGASLELAAQQQNRFACRWWSDVVLRFPKLYDLLDAGKPRHRRQRTLECVNTLELPADVRRFPAHGGAQRNGSAIGVPNDAAGRFRREHANSVLPQESARIQTAQPTRTSSLLVRHQNDSYTAGCEKAFIACRRCRVNHRCQTTFHVRRTTTEQILAFHTRLKLIAALRGNNVVVAAEVKGSRGGSDRREYTRAFASHSIETHPHQFVEQGAGTFLVVIARWILRWNRDQPLREIEDRRLRESSPESGCNLLAVLALHVLLVPSGPIVDTLPMDSPVASCSYQLDHNSDAVLQFSNC